MRSCSYTLLLTTLLAPAATLVAAEPWVPVIKHVPDGVEVVARLVPTERGAELEFVNRGSRTIHFEFYFKDTQRSEDGERNRRMHLRPGQSSGALEYAVPDHGSQGLPGALRFQHIRLGQDLGAFWRD